MIEHQLAAYGLNQSVEHIQGDYSPLMAETVARYHRGEAILFYTWTPNWTVGTLKPGKDVRWLEIPFASLPEGQKDLENRTAIDHVPGCPHSPCALGYPPNDIRAVANRSFIRGHPDIRRLLEQVEIPLADISQQLCKQFDRFADDMEEDHGDRLRHAVNKVRYDGYNPLLASPVRKLIRRDIVTASPSVSVQEAAAIMTRARVSSLLIMEEAPPVGGQGAIAGLITDRDLRTRVMARGLSLSTPVREIMSTEVICCRTDDYAFEAMLTMMRHNLHHLPVLHKTTAVGVITAADIVQYESHGSIYLVSEIFKQTDVAGLKAMSEKVKPSFVHMVNEDANSHMIGSALSFIGSSISQRLLQLGETKLGEPPIPYCYLSPGSTARQEQG